MIAELVTWLRARLDDDERAADAIENASYMHGVESDAEAEILRFADTDRIRREVDAKRRVVDIHYPIEQRGLWRKQTGYDTEIVCAMCVYTGDDEDAGGNRYRYREHAEWPCLTVQYLAAIYSARPGYQEAWRP